MMHLIDLIRYGSSCVVCTCSLIAFVFLIVFQSDILLESINRLLRSHHDPRGFHLEHDSMLM
jgi:hypothetical protein